MGNPSGDLRRDNEFLVYRRALEKTLMRRVSAGTTRFAHMIVTRRESFREEFDEQTNERAPC